MAAEVLVSPIVELLIGKLGSLAYQQFSLIYGVKKDLKKLQRTLNTIKAGLLDAEEQQLHNRQVGVWLEELKDVCYDAEDVFDEFQAEALRRQVLAERGSISKKVGNALSRPKSLAFRFDIGHKIKEIRERLDEIAKNQTDFGFKNIVENRINYIPRQRETHSFVVPSEIIGREKEKEDVIKLLRDSPDDENVSVIPIVGIAGLGKTALAKLVYNDDGIDECFKLKLWICVSNDFVEKKIMIDIIKSATGRTHNDMSLDQLQKEMRDILDGKKYLLVMDDVWNDDVNKWNDFKNLLLGGANGSKILVTTRSDRVADASAGYARYHLKGLPYEGCLSLFTKCAFKEKEEEKFPNLVKIGGEIVKKCGGVPLAVKTLGSLLYSSNDEDHWKDVKDSELWKLEQKEDGILPALKLSYDQLPSHLKQCFVYCSTFPKDFEFNTFYVVQFWMAQGLLQSRKENEELEKIGMQYLKELLSRSFFQDFEELVGDEFFSFKMHDLMHDLALSVAKNECGIVDSHSHFISKNSKKVQHLSFVEDNFIRDGVPSFLSNTCRLRTIHFPLNTVRPNQSFVESCISMFPFLRFLDLGYGSIVFVPKKLGNLRHLRYLDLRGNGKIKKLPNTICKLQSLQTLILEGCEELQELPRDIRYLISLRCLVLTTKQKFLPHNGIELLNSLRSLYIYSCINLEYLVEDIGNLKALRTLSINNCPNLVSLPGSIKCLSSLEELYLLDCEKLNLDWGMGMEEEDTHQDLNGTRPHLRVLSLLKLPKLVELPQWLLRCSANTLQWLDIFKCLNLSALPDSLQNLKSLRVGYCPKVSSLPQDMHGVTTLEKIEIRGCPTLGERCQKGNGEDWRQIAHVPNICLDGHLIIK